MEPIRYQSHRLDHLGIVAGICRGIQLIEQIDACTGHDERKVTVGEAVQAMVLNVLGFVSRPLYLMPEFFANKPVELLIRKGLKAEDFNDDSLGRALDYEAGVTEVFARVASHALKVHGIEHEFYHLDSTSFSFHGAYEEDGEEVEAISIKHEYSRDKRPDLKQAVVSLICTYRSAIPVWLQVLDGNSLDKKIFPEIIQAYLKQMQEGSRPYFIADSALYSAQHIRRLSTSVNWVRRVPESISSVRELFAQVDGSRMKPSKQSGYYLHQVPSDYAGVKQRWLVVFSESAYKREEANLQKRIEKELKKGEK